jgi:hypothetical protein
MEGQEKGRREREEKEAREGKEEKSSSRQRSGCVKRKRGTLGKKNRKNGCALRLGRRRGCGRRRKRIVQRRLNGYAKPSRKCRRLWKKSSSSILSSISVTETRDCIGELSQSFPPSVLILTSSGLMNRGHLFETLQYHHLRVLNKKRWLVVPIYDDRTISAFLPPANLNWLKVPGIKADMSGFGNVAQHTVCQNFPVQKLPWSCSFHDNSVTVSIVGLLLAL